MPEDLVEDGTLALPIIATLQGWRCASMEGWTRALRYVASPYSVLCFTRLRKRILSGWCRSGWRDS